MYNNTYAIAKRLGGNDTTPGFGSAVSGLARVVVLDAETETEAAMAADNSTINGEVADQNVSRNIEMNVRNVKAFKIDFEIKPNYILDGDTANPLKAPVRLYPALRVVAPHINRLMGLANAFLENIIRNVVKDRLATINATKVNVYRGHIFYAICFPNWSGKAINQDPTFTAYVEIDASTTARTIDGFSFTIFALVSMGLVFVLLKKFRKH